MQDKYIHILSIALITAGLVVTAFLYWAEPRSLAEVATKGQVVTGTYSIDKAEVDRGIASFHSDRFEEARAAFIRADPERRDAGTQFYVAYSYYRQGWGRLYHDDRLYAEGLTAVDRAIALAPGGRLIVDDPALGMHTAEELKAELEAGMRRDASDFNPMRVFRKRK